MTAALQHEAQNLAALLPPLLLEAERVASAVYQGIHGRRRAGMGESFWQFRRYAAGDSAARIDWRQSARTDRLFIREREWEAAQSVYLWADGSGSMYYGSQKNIPQKAERAQVLMLALASLLLRGGENVAWLAREPVIMRGKNDLGRLAGRLGTAGKRDSMPPDIPLRRHAHIVLCSDFLMPPAELEKLMRRYAALNLHGMLLHVLDPAEENLPFEGRVEILGCEDEAPLLLPNAASLRDAYRRRMEDHKARLLHIAESTGWFYLRHVTDTPPHEALVRLFQNLAADIRGI
jgi:uncharacterized protein (DUF58 family)